jgi:hypothetical protein
LLPCVRNSSKNPAALMGKDLKRTARHCKQQNILISL